MTDKIVNIFGGHYEPPKDEVDAEPNVVKMLEILLDQAKKGYVQEVAIVAGMADGRCAFDMEGFCDNHEAMLGGITGLSNYYYNVYMNPFTWEEEGE